MIDPTPNELQALDHGGQRGGEVLDSLGKTDLATLSNEQWQAFVEAIVTGYCDHLRTLATRDQQRLAGLADTTVPF